MTQKRLLSVRIALWAITGLPCGIPVILIDTIALLKEELADAFLYPYSHNCVSNRTDRLSAKVDDANHHPRELISQKSPISRLIQPDLVLWCDCANELPVISLKCILVYYEMEFSIHHESHMHFQFCSTKQ